MYFMKSVSTIFLLFCLFSSFGFSQNSDIEILRKNLINDALINRGFQPRIERYIAPDYGKTKQYLNKMNSEGGWNDIDYTDRDNNWDPLHHLNRVLIMAYNYSKNTSKYYQNKKLLAGLEKAISHWYTINPKCDNWYKNRIAKQFYLNIIALLLEDKIDSSLQTKMINDLTEIPTMTGSNRTLLATSTFYRGVLTNNTKMIKLGVTGVTDQIKISTKEGIQPDFSFHQHGHFIYNGSYGFNFLRESVWMATMVHGTSFAFSDEFIKTLRNYYWEGTRRMIRGGLIDYNVRGRQVGRGDAIKLFGNLLIPVLKRMIIADSDYAGEYNSSMELIEKQLPQNTFGHYHFWRSDYSIHHRKLYSTSLKMCSERTVGIELNMNTENKLGYWLPYGLTYIYRHGKEYDAIFPAWDWARLPGVTNPYIKIEETRKGKAHTQQTSFVGGVSNGKYGISSMDFSKNKTVAKKAWFWFDDEWVALGAGINSEHDSVVITSVNQTLLKGKVFIDGEPFLNGKETLENPTWILHDSVGYVFPENKKVEIKAEMQSGNMQDIYGLGKDTVYSKPVFSLWFNHGVKPNNESYEYMVVPGIDKNSLEKYTKNLPLYILLNTSQIQAVYHKKLDLTGIVFYEKGEFEYEGLVANTDAPCLVLIDKKNSEVSISDPTTKLKEIKIQLKKDKTVILDQVVKLPANGFAGKSVTLNW